MNFVLLVVEMRWEEDGGQREAWAGLTKRIDEGCRKGIRTRRTGDNKFVGDVVLMIGGKLVVCCFSYFLGGKGFGGSKEMMLGKTAMMDGLYEDNASRLERVSCIVGCCR